MIKRNTQQRRHAIITLLNEQGKVSLADLSDSAENLAVQGEDE